MCGEYSACRQYAESLVSDNRLAAIHWTSSCATVGQTQTIRYEMLAGLQSVPDRMRCDQAQIANLVSNAPHRNDMPQVSCSTCLLS